VGGGIAGLAIASRVPRTAGRTAIAVDREPAYVYKPMLHAIAAGTSDFSQQETNSIAQARDRHFVFHPGELKGIDRDAQRIRLGPLMLGGRSIVSELAISYDTLILATGSQANDDFGTPGVRQYCHMVDSRSQALDLNREIRTRLAGESGGEQRPVHRDSRQRSDRC
jgi:NADH dehydrogenase